MRQKEKKRVRRKGGKDIKRQKGERKSRERKKIQERDRVINLINVQVWTEKSLKRKCERDN